MSSSRIKNTAVITLMLVITAGVVYLYIKDTQKKNQEAQDQRIEEEQTSGFSTGTTNDSTLADFDGDGLLDWEEKLWGTNPSLADSDGDGVSDLEETRTGLITVPTENAEQVTQDFSITESFGISLYSALAEARQGGEVSKADLAQIAESTERKVKQEITKNNAIVQKVEYSELTEDSVASYSSSILILATQHTINREFIEKLTVGLLEAEQNVETKQLSALASSMDKAVEILLGSSPPILFKNSHEELLRNYNNLSRGLRSFLNSQEEPVVALVYLQKTEASILGITRALQETKLLLMQ